MDHDRRRLDRLNDCSRGNRRALESDPEASAGCFGCLKIFPACMITEWDDDLDDLAVTALCPECSSDTVLSSVDIGGPEELNVGLLLRMHDMWLSPPEPWQAPDPNRPLG
jgi:hypothetical protein